MQWKANTEERETIYRAQNDDSLVFNSMPI